MARVLSGIQPSGEMHLGNYLGAVRHWVAAQDVDDAEERVVVLGRDPVADRPEQVAEVLVAGGLDARQDPCHRRATLVARRPDDGRVCCR